MEVYFSFFYPTYMHTTATFTVQVCWSPTLLTLGESSVTHRASDTVSSLYYSSFWPKKKKKKKKYFFHMNAYIILCIYHTFIISFCTFIHKHGIIRHNHHAKKLPHCVSQALGPGGVPPLPFVVVLWPQQQRGATSLAG